MGKIFYLMGKSSSGKDTIYKQLMADEDLHLKNIVLYTTKADQAGRTGRYRVSFHNRRAACKSGKRGQDHRASRL